MLLEAQLSTFYHWLVAQLVKVQVNPTIDVLAVLGEVVVTAPRVLGQLTQELVSLSVCAIEADAVDGHRVLQGHLG